MILVREYCCLLWKGKGVTRGTAGNQDTALMHLVQCCQKRIKKLFPITMINVASTRLACTQLAFPAFHQSRRNFFRNAGQNGTPTERGKPPGMKETRLSI